jgi:hypothetical protein
MAAPSGPSKKGKEPADLFTKGKEFLDMYSKVEEFTKELMDENTRLQNQINELMGRREQALTEGTQSSEEADLVHRIEKLKEDKQEILNRYRHVEEENKDFMQRYMEIELENNNLANLYVASYQLHSTLELGDVLEIITEIIINLIGAQTFAVLMLNDKRHDLEPVKSEGMPLEAVPSFKMGEGIIGGVAKNREPYYHDSYDRNAPTDFAKPLVCIPLMIKDDVIGVIAVYHLLSQKQRLVKVDYDLFSLLAAHAATAIFSAKLYGDSVRKQATIKGFLDLLTH